VQLRVAVLPAWPKKYFGESDIDPTDRDRTQGSANPSAKVIPMLKSYSVTFRGSPTERLSPHALDEVKGLDNALIHALNLIRAGHQDVAIQDGTGKTVSGDLLMACCRGEKELTPDLFS
jgi:hypothetical protein